MADKTEKQKQFFDGFKKANDVDKSTGETEEINETDELQEATTTGSVGGSYETPFGFMKGDEKRLEDLKENKKMNITLKELYAVVKKTLIKEEVYSETPSKSTGDNMIATGEEKGKATSTKNAVKEKTYDSTAAKATKSSTDKTGTDAKKAAKDSAKKAEDYTKNNLKDSEVSDVNETKVQDDDQRIEAYANGLEDTQYDNISPEKQKQNKEYLKNESAMDSPNSQDTGVNQQMADDAVKRNNEASNDDANYRFFGGDVTTKAKGEGGGDKKKIAYENAIPKLKFKAPFKSGKDMLTRVKNLPAKHKINESVFIMSDGNNDYKIRWEGHSSNGVPIVLEHRNVIAEKAAYEKHMLLSEYNTTQSNNSSSKENEHDIFKQILNQSRELGETVEKTLEESYKAPVKKKLLSEAYDFVGLVGNPNLKQTHITNDRNDVKIIQLALNDVIGAGLKVDGRYGKNTQHAIRKYYMKAGQSQEMAMKQHYLDAERASQLSADYIKKGLSGSVGKGGQNDTNDVYKVQMMLNSAIGARLKVDGMFGRNTQGAIEEFNGKFFDNRSPIINNPRQQKVLVGKALGISTPTGISTKSDFGSKSLGSTSNPNV